MIHPRIYVFYHYVSASQTVYKIYVCTRDTRKSFYFSKSNLMLPSHHAPTNCKTILYYNIVGIWNNINFGLNWCHGMTSAYTHTRVQYPGLCSPKHKTLVYIHLVYVLRHWFRSIAVLNECARVQDCVVLGWAVLIRVFHRFQWKYHFACVWNLFLLYFFSLFFNASSLHFVSTISAMNNSI